MLRFAATTLGILMALRSGRALAAPEKAPAPAAEKAPENKLSKEEQKLGFKLLFDGKTTAGWRGYQKPDAPAGWKVIDGVLTRVDKAGDLVTVDEFQDFELTIDWRIADHSNSGIMYRVSEAEHQPFYTGPEYQILDDAHHPDANKGAEGTRKSGAIYDMFAPSKDVVHPAGRWNHAKIVAKGNHVEHWLNGEKVVDVELGSAAWNARVPESKWAKVATYGKMPKGHIDLQDHGDKIEFANIKIRVLGSPAAKAKAK